jgi:hypothetical protein
MLDRLMQNHNRLTLAGESLRKVGQTKAKTGSLAAASQEVTASSSDATVQIKHEYIPDRECLRRPGRA